MIELKVKESGTLLYLRDVFKKAYDKQHMQSREVKNYTLNFLSSHLKFNRLASKLEKNIGEHKKFLEFMKE